MRRNAISAYFEPEDPNLAVVQEIEDVLGIDQEFPVVRELVICLTELLETAAESAKKEAWQHALRIVCELGEAAGWQEFEYALPGFNPLVLAGGHYPIPEVLLSKGYQENNSQLHGVVMLFLNALMNEPSKDYSKHASDLAFVFGLGLQNDILKKLPFYTTSADYNKDLSDYLKHIDWKLVNSLMLPFIRALHSLVDGQPDPKYNDNNAVVSRRRRRSIRQEVISDVDEDSQGGNVEAVITDEADSINGESPQFAAVFVADVVPDETDVGLNATEQEIDSRARESRHWISRHQRLVAGVQGRLTSIERRHLVSFIRNGIDCGEVQKELASGLLGLMYVTGQDLASLMNCSVGPEGTLAQMGTYRRDLSPPSDAFKPASAVTSFLEPNAEWIDLQLPEPLGEWLIARCRNMKASLGQCLGVSLDQAGDVLSRAMVELRDSGRFPRLRIERIPAALALELTIERHDPVVTFLLSSRPNHGAPMLAYYVAHSVEQLASIYSSVTQSMMSIK